MTDTQILTVVLSTSMTLVVVIIGLFLNNRALELVRNELRAEVKVVEAEVKVVDSKVDVLRDSFQMLRADIRLVMHKLDSLDTRLTRLEERRA